MSKGELNVQHRRVSLLLYADVCLSILGNTYHILYCRYSNHCINL